MKNFENKLKWGGHLKFYFLVMIDNKVIVCVTLRIKIQGAVRTKFE